ncbi:MAG TPA: bile acid:sodium symporter family protein [Candidatus Corynebacterium gallistercoris]|uniref:Bile acid:sodium symporter family protein n=1 Tax=Candidatus Corynebacterium gallistercoris TaxID=2838530 RepID=A0A9D1RX60_9CORY|nr:bile acid:sodium symporter family protein [Candidatus Corynebacterium gallistercoris]
MTPEDKSANLAVWAFPAFILLGSAAAYFFPEPFTPLTPHVTTMIAIIMLCMGLTLTLPDFGLVLRRPWPIFVGVVGQFIIMPLGAVVVAKMLGLNPMLAVGLLMLGSVPGGTTSNVVSYLARGDVALSVTMTSVSTVLSPIVTPAIMLLLAGEETPVNGSAMALSLVKTVLLPVLGGLLFRVAFDRFVALVLPILPWISILAIGGVVFPAVAKTSATLATVGLVVLVAVIIHNLVGYVLGYAASKALKFSEPVCRTTSLEISTQSAGLASGMSGTYWSAEAAIPGAIAAVWHNVSGAIFAFLMRWIDGRRASHRISEGEPETLRT